jgi:hypothetical protein
VILEKSSLHATTIGETAELFDSLSKSVSYLCCIGILEYKQMLILFCNNFIDPKQVDPDFENEYSAAVKAGLITALISFEALKNERNVVQSLRMLKTQPELTKAIYRGWMFSPADFTMP